MSASVLFYFCRLKIAVSKYKLAVNWYLLILLSIVTINIIVQVVLMAILGPQPKYLMAFALSFVGMFLYGFHFWEGKRVLYYKKKKIKVDMSDIKRNPEDQETSGLFVTEDGNLLY